MFIVFGYFNIRGIVRTKIAIATLLGVLHLTVPAEAQQNNPAIKGCKNNPCLIVEYEPALAGEASVLVDALRVRLAKHGLVVRFGAEDEFPISPDSEKGGERNAQAQWLWVVHLRQLSGEIMLVAVDNLAAVSEDDVVREIRREQDLEATAWTMALMIEEVVSPYLEGDEERAALGAGLAIIEPKVVGGIKKTQPFEAENYPQVKSVGVGMAGYWILAAENVVVGPRVALEGSFSSMVVASFEIAWVGWSDFASGEIKGSMSLLPIDVLFGYILWRSRVVELTSMAGFSVGFSIYKTESRFRQRTDMLFEPMAQGLVRAAFEIHGPWKVYISGGAGIPFVRDKLENKGVEVYYQSWILPRFDVGIQLEL